MSRPYVSGEKRPTSMSRQRAPPSVLWNSPMRMAAYGTPGFAGVRATARMARMHENRPDLQAALGKGQPLPGITAVLAPVRPVVGADIDDVGVRGVDGDGLDLGPLGQPLGELLPAAFAHTAEDSRALAGRERADPDVHARRSRRIRHGGVLSSDVAAVR